MKKNYFRIVRNAFVIACLGFSLVGCEGEDGANGLNGIAGINGEDGTDGNDGTNGVGFDELTQYGSITINVAGMRSDDVPFTHEAELKFSHNDTGKNDFTNNDPNYDFSVIRFLNSPDAHDDNSVELDLTVNDAGLETQSFEFNVEFDGYAIVSSEDLKYFTISNDYDYDGTGVSNFSITDYSFDAVKNELKFSFTLDVAAANNTTGNDMTISGNVDVIVLENINGGGGPFPPKK